MILKIACAGFGSAHVLLETETLMKAVWLFLISAALLIFGVWLTFNALQGTANVNMAWPLSQCSFQISGVAKGGVVPAAILLLFFSVVLFISGLIATIKMAMRPAVESSIARGKSS